MGPSTCIFIWLRPTTTAVKWSKCISNVLIFNLGAMLVFPPSSNYRPHYFPQLLQFIFVQAITSWLPLSSLLVIGRKIKWMCIRHFACSLQRINGHRDHFRPKNYTRLFGWSREIYYKSFVLFSVNYGICNPKPTINILFKRSLMHQLLLQFCDGKFKLFFKISS